MGQLVATPRLGSRRLAFVVPITLALALAGGRALGQSGECGDCDGDESVGINELISAVSILLGNAQLADCEAADVDKDGSVNVPDLVRAVGRATTGICGNLPVASETPSPTPTATSSPVPQLEGPDLIQASSEVALQNVSSFHVIGIGFAAVQRMPRGFRLATYPRRAAVVLPASGGGGQPPCDAGDAVTSCANNVLSVTYDRCRTATAAGGNVVRSGRVVQEIINDERPPIVCETGEIRGEEDTVFLTMENFRQTETDADGIVLAELNATAAERFVPARAGCLDASGEVTVDGVQTIDGSIILRCTAAATTISCPPGGTDRELRPRNLTVTRSSGGFPCEVGIRASGELALQDRSSGAEIRQSFDDFLITEAKGGDNSDTSFFTQNGRLGVDCLGALTYETSVTRDTGSTIPVAGAITFPPSATCPIDGVLEVRRPLEALGGASVTAAAALRSGGATLAGGEPTPVVDMAYRDRLFRAQRGTVYQVLQNSGSDLGFRADGIQITSVVGTAAGPLNSCARIANATVDPQAVVATEPGFAFPPERVFKSPIIGDATLPCFNRTFDFGRGIVCIGPGCSSDCTCRDGGECAAFSIGGTPITDEADDIPAATLVRSIPPLTPGSPCEGLGGDETYRFGGGGPTTETRQCLAAPSDGFVLRSTPSQFVGGTAGTTAIFAYDAPLASLFNAGSAGFAIDEDGDSQICGGQPGVLHIGRAQGNSVESPVIQYTTAGGVQFDFDGDHSVDRTLGTCAVSALLRCQ